MTALFLSCFTYCHFEKKEKGRGAVLERFLPLGRNAMQSEASCVN